LRLHAGVVRTEGRKIVTNGSITTAADPATVLVSADGVFIAPEPELAGVLFPHRPAPRES
jgi:hypothetical protein